MDRPVLSCLGLAGAAGEKMALCARLGVAEYFLFDPEGDYLSPTLQGYRLAGTEYERIPPDATGGVRRAVLGVDMRAEGARLVLTDASSGERLLRAEEAYVGKREAEAARHEAEAALREADARAREAEAEVERLRRELARRS